MFYLWNTERIKICILYIATHQTLCLLASLLFSFHPPCKSSGFNPFLPTFNYLASMSFPVYPLFTILRHPFLFGPKKNTLQWCVVCLPRHWKVDIYEVEKAILSFFLFPFLSMCIQKCRKVVKLANILFPFRESVYINFCNADIEFASLVAWH